MVRLAAAISTLVFGALLVWVAVITLSRPDPVVVPTDGVIASQVRDDLPTGTRAAAALAERAQLQRWRAESGPSPEGALTTRDTRADPPGAGTAEAPPPARGEALVREWTDARDREWSVLADRGYTAGTASLPAARAAVLMQPEGRDFRRRHEGTIPYAGGWIIFGVSLVLSLFLLLRGRVPLAKGFSGREVERFSALERANHWLTATSFVVLGLTGLVLIYGWAALQPVIGSSAFGWVAGAALYLHIAFAGPFSLGVGVMAAIWLRGNLPSRLDLEWLRRFGGFLSDSGDTPPARRFNAGQKLVFWGVLGGGILMFLSGVTLMFPFYWTDVVALQWVLLGHGLVALLMVGMIIGHIYIGTIGMEGAFDAMWSGRVDRNWAEEHHRLWLAELERGEREEPEPRRRPRSHVPAE